jgi:hypothetical protein
MTGNTGLTGSTGATGTITGPIGVTGPTGAAGQSKATFLSAYTPAGATDMSINAFAAFPFTTISAQSNFTFSGGTTIIIPATGIYFINYGLIGQGETNDASGIALSRNGSTILNSSVGYLTITTMPTGSLIQDFLFNDQLTLINYNNPPQPMIFSSQIPGFPSYNWGYITIMMLKN